MTSEMEARLAGFDQSPAMVVVVEGPDLLAVACNDAATAALGNRAIIGQSVRGLVDEIGGNRLLQMYADTCRTGEPRGGHACPVEIDRDDGSAAELLVDITMTPWRGDDGAVRGVIGSATDVTQQVRAQPETGPGRGRDGARDAASDLSDFDTHRDTDLDTVRTMQDALLPPDMPVVPCLDIAARYLLSADATVAGGDWFDAVVRPSGRVALVTGDVPGRGVTASATMGQLRAVLHERLLGSDSLEAAVASLDRYAATRAESHAATVCVVDIDPDSGRFHYCTAGHPPPLVVSEHGETRFLGPTGTGRSAPARASRSPRTGWRRPSSCCCSPTARSSAPGGAGPGAPSSWPGSCPTSPSAAMRCRACSGGRWSASVTSDSSTWCGWGATPTTSRCSQRTGPLRSCRSRAAPGGGGVGHPRSRGDGRLARPARAEPGARHGGPALARRAAGQRRHPRIRRRRRRCARLVRRGDGQRRRPHRPDRRPRVHRARHGQLAGARAGRRGRPRPRGRAWPGRPPRAAPGRRRHGGDVPAPARPARAAAVRGGRRAADVRGRRRTPTPTPPGSRATGSSSWARCGSTPPTSSASTCSWPPAAGACR